MDIAFFVKKYTKIIIDRNSVVKFIQNAKYKTALAWKLLTT